MTRLADSLDESVKCLWVYGANPMGSTSDQNRIRQRLLRDDLFTVVMEQFPTDTVDYADIVLPATMQTEHLDLHQGYGHMYLMWNEPAVAPAGEALSTTETFRRLAVRMGLTDPALHATDLEIATELLAGTPTIQLDELRKRGWARLDVAEPFVPFTGGFPTPSGQLEFVSDLAEKAGLSRVATYVPSLSARSRKDGRPDVDHPRLPHLPQHDLRQQPRAAPGAPRARPWSSTPRTPSAGAWSRGRGSGSPTSSARSRGSSRSPTRSAGAWPPRRRATGPSSAAAPTPTRWSRKRDADLGQGPVYHDNLVEITPA